MIQRTRATSDVLRGVVDHHQADYLSLSELKDSLHERGFGLLMGLCAAILIFLPPGVSSIPAIPIFLLGLQMMMGRDSPWLPKWLGAKRIQRKSLASMVERASPILKRIERFLRPRLRFMSSSHAEKLVGFFTVAFAVSIIIPLPLTHFVPAVGIILMSLGTLSEDGILILLGMGVGSVGLGITSLVILLGTKAALGILASYGIVL